MRRLASQSRDDAYNSQRDYQFLVDAQGGRFAVTDSGTARLCFTADLVVPDDHSRFAGFGAYLRSDRPLTISATLQHGDAEKQVQLSVDASWRRFGLAVEIVGRPAQTLALTLQSQDTFVVDVWGLTAGVLALPETIDAGVASAGDLNKKHLMPETLYLDHSSACSLEIAPEYSSHVQTSGGALINLKKCSYCGRMLPVDPDRLGALAFHKHLAKKTLHQNECRSCKKWRINDGFNPLRTTDQLHESSVITRERKIFLREPEILQSIKDRSGAGLKSQVWERFDRRCFNCNRTLELNEVQLDHTRPLAYLWPIDEHATCLCAECNNWKKDKFPAQFYTETQLKRLTRICGLAYDDLVRISVNLHELDRILSDIGQFSREWDPRTFAATARRISSILPDVDLIAELHRVDAHAHSDLMARLADRPLPVEETTY